MVYRSDTYEKVVQNKWLSEGKKKKKKITKPSNIWFFSKQNCITIHVCTYLTRAVIFTRVEVLESYWD